MPMQNLPKLNPGDKVAILSPSFAAPGVWPHVHELGLARLRDVFGLVPVEFPATRKLGATAEERSQDLIRAFEDPEIKAVIATLGGNDQVTYVKHLPSAPFANNPKPFFGYSDNTHFANFLWVNGVPSFYGGCLFTQFARQGGMDEFTVDFLQKAFFQQGEFELRASATYNDINLTWDDPENLNKQLVYERNEGWRWDGERSAEGITWGGCLESIDELLKHDIQIPSPDAWNDIVLVTETSEELPSSAEVSRIYRAMGERGLLTRVKGVLMGRAKAWEFEQQNSAEQKKAYRDEQYEAIIRAVRDYNPTAPVIQNVDFGHTDPQIALPYGKRVRIDATSKKIAAEF